jgi:hypothetical protein
MQDTMLKRSALLPLALALPVACDDSPGTFPWVPTYRSNCTGTCIKMLGQASAPIAPDQVVTHGAMENPECDFEQVALIETSHRFANIDDLWHFFQVEAAKLGANGVDMRHIDNEHDDNLYRGSVLAPDSGRSGGHAADGYQRFCAGDGA